MTENRKQHRVGCDMILNKIEAGHTNICRATDVSLGGIRLERVAEAYRSDGASVQLQFALPGDEDPIWVAGHKVYDDEGQVGVRFTNISHGHFVKLRAWLRAQAIQDGLPEFSM